MKTIFSTNQFKRFKSIKVRPQAQLYCIYDEIYIPSPLLTQFSLNKVFLDYLQFTIYWLASLMFLLFFIFFAGEKTITDDRIVYLSDLCTGMVVFGLFMILTYKLFIYIELFKQKT